MDRKSFIHKSGMLMMQLALLSPFSRIKNAKANSGYRGSKGSELLTLFLAGDVMTGRGIDQVLPNSVDPQLYESYIKNAGEYVKLAERKHGPIPEAASYRYIWGDALEVLQEINPEIRIINLETAVTTSGDYWDNKGIHYRMHPGNRSLFTEAGIDISVLGNNHVLDWGYRGLKETVKSLRKAGLKTVGAGTDHKSASKPAVIPTANARLLVFSFASPSAGIPMSWSAADDQPGVNLLPYLNSDYAEKVSAHIQQYKKKGDRVILSVHWGENWGYDIPAEQRSFAKSLIDEGGVDIIFGHSSHHPKGIEVYKDRLILYGCGDLINDYEGIGGHKKYRPDLRLMYFPRIEDDGSLKSLQMVTMRMHRFQLQRAGEEASMWMQEVLDKQCDRFGHDVKLSAEGKLILYW